MSEDAKPTRRPWWVAARSVGHAIVLVSIAVVWEVFLLIEQADDPWRTLFQILWAVYGALAVSSLIYWLVRRSTASRPDRWYEE